MRFPVSSASLNLAEQKPAIVQVAKKDWRYYEAKIMASEECTGRLYREYKEGEAWKEHYKTWTDACVPLGKSRRQVDRIIELDATIRSECPNVDHEKESAALTQVEKAREVKAPAPQPEEPKEEEPEKPAVHSADEKDYEVKPTNGHVAKPKLENGKPKQSLAAWREMEESLIGRALNRADELNRQCPNPQFHAKLIASLKAALTLLEQWKASVL